MPLAVVDVKCCFSVTDVGTIHAVTLSESTLGQRMERFRGNPPPFPELKTRDTFLMSSSVRQPWSSWDSTFDVSLQDSFAFLITDCPGHGWLLKVLCLLGLHCLTVFFIAESRTFCNCMGRWGISPFSSSYRVVYIPSQDEVIFLPPYSQFLDTIQELLSSWRWKVYDHQRRDDMFLLDEINAGCLDLSAEDCWDGLGMQNDYFVGVERT